LRKSSRAPAGMLGRPWRWLRPAARRYLDRSHDSTRPRHRDVVEFLRRDQGVKRALSKDRHDLTVDEWLSEPQQMRPVEAAETWAVPAIESVAALAEWLGVHPGELDWFADLKVLAAHRDTPAQLRHYHYRVLTKRSGNIRLIEAPKPRLKELQRQILHQILNGVPAHSAVHGFLKRRSIKTFTAPHVGQRVVLCMDLREFFPPSPAPVFRASFAPPAIPNRLPISSAVSAPTPRLPMPGTCRRLRSIRANSVRRGSCTPGHTCRRVRPLHRRWRTYASIGPIAVWPAWRKRLARPIPVMPTMVRHERKGPRRAQCV
jgi:hypothetical protein